MHNFVSRLALCLTIAAFSLAARAEEKSADSVLPPIKTAGSDNQGRITVNGQPFFPILMYDVPVDDESLTMFREQGFNVLSARVEDGPTLLNHGFYAAAHGSNTTGLNLDGVLFGIGMDSPALNWKEGLLEKSQADLLQMRKAFPSRPIFHAIGYWEDEPEGVFTNKLPAKARYEELVKVLDVSAPYLYPVPYQPVRSVGEALGRADAASAGRKPLLPVLQLFAWKPEDRYPTPAELKCMAYLSLIHGADGLGYYSYNYVTGKEKTNIAREQPALWRSVKSLNAEVQRIGEFLLGSSPIPGVQVTGSTAIEWRAAHNGDTVLLLLTNTALERQTVKLKWTSQALTLTPIQNDAVKVAIENGLAEITLEPHQSLACLGPK